MSESRSAQQGNEEADGSVHMIRRIEIHVTHNTPASRVSEIVESELRKVFTDGQTLTIHVVWPSRWDRMVSWFRGVFT